MPQTSQSAFRKGLLHLHEGREQLGAVANHAMVRQPPACTLGDRASGHHPVQHKGSQIGWTSGKVRSWQGSLASTIAFCGLSH